MAELFIAKVIAVNLAVNPKKPLAITTINDKVVSVVAACRLSTLLSYFA